MNEKFLPQTRLGKLDHLAEECAEVILAIAKLKRFGPGPNTVDGVEFPDNIERLHEEMQDLEAAMRRVRCCDLTKVERYAIDKIVSERQEQAAGYDIVALTFAEAYAELRRACPQGDLRIHLFIDKKE